MQNPAENLILSNFRAYF